MNRTLFDHYVKRYNLDVVEKDGEIQSIHFTHKGDKLEMKEITKNEWQATDTNVSFSFTVNDR